MNMRYAHWLLSPPCLLLWACPSSHPGQSSDTATSWLRTCVSSEQCGQYGSCIQQKCTLACTAESRNDCLPLAAHATCDSTDSSATGRCQVPCSARADCAALGGSYACQDGLCGPPSLLYETAGALQWKVQDAKGQGAGRESLRSFTSTRVGDHVRVHYDSYPAPANMYGALEQNGPLALNAVDIYRDGTLKSVRSEQFLSTAAGNERLNFAYADGGPQGAVGVVVRSGSLLEEKPCELRFIVWNEPAASVALPYRCEHTRARVVGIPNRDEWFVLLDDDERGVSLGRFSSSASDWSLAPQALPGLAELAAHNSLDLTAIGDDALLLVPGGDGPAALVRIPNAASAHEELEPTEVQVIDAGELRPNSERPGFFAWEGLTDGWLVPTWWYSDTTPDDRTSIAAYPIDASGRVGTRIDFQLHEQTFIHHALASAPERGLVGVCSVAMDFASSSPRARVSLSVFDDHGELLSGPTNLGAQAGVGACMISWSGSEFVVVWPEVVQDTLDSTLRARMFGVR